MVVLRLPETCHDRRIPCEHPGCTTVQLMREQIDTNRERGFPTLPGLLSREEVAVPEAAMHNIVQRARDDVARDTYGSISIRLWDQRFAMLARHRRILGPAEQLDGSKPFIHGARANTGRPTAPSSTGTRTTASTTSRTARRSRAC